MDALAPTPMPELVDATRPLANFPWRWREREARWRRTVAYHEAGHALLAWKQGRAFTQVSIVPDWESGGRVQGVARPDGERCDPADVEMFVAYLFGGAAAQQVCLGDPGRGWYADSIRTWKWARVAFPEAGAAAACRERAWGLAIETVTRHRAALDALARHVLAEGEMDGASARRVMRHADSKLDL